MMVEEGLGKGVERRNEGRGEEVREKRRNVGK